jgi:hypothetical protein
MYIYSDGDSCQIISRYVMSSRGDQFPREDDYVITERRRIALSSLDREIRDYIMTCIRTKVNSNMQAQETCEIKEGYWTEVNIHASLLPATLQELSAQFPTLECCGCAFVSSWGPRSRRLCKLELDSVVLCLNPP